MKFIWITIAVSVFSSMHYSFIYLVKCTSAIINDVKSSSVAPNIGMSDKIMLVIIAWSYKKYSSIPCMLEKENILNKCHKTQLSAHTHSKLMKFNLYTDLEYQQTSDMQQLYFLKSSSHINEYTRTTLYKLVLTCTETSKNCL